MATDNLVDKLKKSDLMPLGKRETKEVTKTKNSIPSFKKLLPVDSLKLYNDFKNYSYDDGYVKSRSFVFQENDIDVEEYLTYMQTIGFNKSNYRVCPLRNTNGDLTINEDTYTYKFFEDWPTGIFRPQYNITLSDWRVKSHVDYEDDSIHGFRVLIPLNNSSYMIVEDKEVKLEMNHSYFVDVTKPHAAWSEAGRVVLSFQMDWDILL